MGFPDLGAKASADSVARVACVAQDFRRWPSPAIPQHEQLRYARLILVFGGQRAITSYGRVQLGAGQVWPWYSRSRCRNPRFGLQLSQSACRCQTCWLVFATQLMELRCTHPLGMFMDHGWGASLWSSAEVKALSKNRRWMPLTSGVSMLSASSMLDAAYALHSAHGHRCME